MKGKIRFNTRWPIDLGLFNDSRAILIMQIPIIGFIFIVTGITAFLFNRKLLYDLTIFFIPFSATAVINIGQASNSSSIQPYMLFASLWILSLIIKSLLKKGKKTLIIKVPIKEYKAILPLILFSVVALISLVMPLLIDGSELGNKTGRLGFEEPIYFTSTNITQYIYLLLGIIFSICIYSYNKKKENYLHTLKVYYYAILFTVIWGLIEYLLKITGKEPIPVFNNSLKTGNMVLAVIEDGGQRIASVCAEASIFVQVVIVILPFVIIGIQNNKYITNKYFDCFYLFLTILTILLSTSSSGILALIILAILIFLIKQHSLSIGKKILYTTSFFFLLFIFVTLTFLFWGDMLQMMIFDKPESYSAMERLGNIIQAWYNFENYPLLGVGWGSVTSMDLVVKLLSNTGIAGTLLFLIYLFITGRNLIRCSKNEYLYTEKLRDAILISFILVVFLSEIAGLSFMFGHPWLILGLSMICQSATKK
ncbi:MAG: hypothetical protein LBR26_16550 [Prevotella sp.]|nr:hypothetical protein [Prevotella sp.]